MNHAPITHLMFFSLCFYVALLSFSASQISYHFSQDSRHHQYFRVKSKTRHNTICNGLELKSSKVLNSVSDNLKSKFQRRLSAESMIFIEKEARETLHLLIIECNNLPIGKSEKLASLREMLREKENQLQSLRSDEHRKAVEEGEFDFFLVTLSLQSIVINIAETKLNLRGIREWNDNIDNLFFARAKDKQTMLYVFIYAASVMNGIAFEKEKITKKEQEKNFAIQTKEELKIIRRKKLEQDRRKINNILDSMHQRPCV